MILKLDRYGLFPRPSLNMILKGGIRNKTDNVAEDILRCLICEYIADAYEYEVEIRAWFADKCTIIVHKTNEWGLRFFKCSFVLSYNGDETFCLQGTKNDGTFINAINFTLNYFNKNMSFIMRYIDRAM